MFWKTGASGCLTLAAKDRLAQDLRQLGVQVDRRRDASLRRPDPPVLAELLADAQLARRQGDVHLPQARDLTEP